MEASDNDFVFRLFFCFLPFTVRSVFTFSFFFIPDRKRAAILLGAHDVPARGARRDGVAGYFCSLVFPFLFCFVLFFSCLFPFIVWL